MAYVMLNGFCLALVFGFVLTSCNNRIAVIIKSFRVKKRVEMFNPQQIHLQTSWNEDHIWICTSTHFLQTHYLFSDGLDAMCYAQTCWMFFHIHKLSTIWLWLVFKFYLVLNKCIKYVWYKWNITNHILDSNQDVENIKSWFQFTNTCFLTMSI